MQAAKEGERVVPCGIRRDEAGVMSRWAVAISREENINARWDGYEVETRAVARL